MVNFKIEEGNFDRAYLIMENVTTGEKQTIPGQAKYSLNLKFNSDYILSFNKPGYITKKIELNTTAPADRIEQNFYPIGMTVILIQQYEGVNIVVFNQPVSKYKYSSAIDDFDFDTDYTKQIQSALKAAEDELAKKKVEEKAKVVTNAKESEKAKADSIAKAKAEAKAKLEEDQLQRAETKAKLDAETKERTDSVARAKKDASVKVEEDKRQQAKAKMEEEERRKALAKSDADERAKAAKSLQEEEARKKAEAKKEAEEKRKLAASASAGRDLKKEPLGSTGNDSYHQQNAVPNYGIENHDPEKSQEVPATVNVEEISETNRTISKATVTKNNRETIYRKIAYKWGGVFYFEGDRSITQNAFLLATKFK